MGAPHILLFFARALAKTTEAVMVIIRLKMEFDGTVRCSRKGVRFLRKSLQAEEFAENELRVSESLYRKGYREMVFESYIR